jgi:LCP family protein required for cell wall assembly
MDAHVTDKAGTGSAAAGSTAMDENARPAQPATAGGGTAGSIPGDEAVRPTPTDLSAAPATDPEPEDGSGTVDEAVRAASGTGTEAAPTEAGQDDTSPDDGPPDAAEVAADGPDGTAATGSGPGKGGRRSGGDRADGGHGKDGPTGASGPDGDNDHGGGDGPGDNGPGGASGHGGGAGGRPRYWMRWAALGLSLVLLAAAGAGWWFYRKLDANITTDTTAATELRTYEKERPSPGVTGAQNILLLGSDTRAGAGNNKYGRDENGGSQRSDTTILLHIAADRKSATAMSIPRDLVVTIPSCGKGDGGDGDGDRTKERVAQFNWAFQFGGAACTIRTVEKFTGIRIDHHMVIDFRGFKDMVNAVDGVEVCLTEPIDDKDARLKLPAGPQTLHGEQALGFVRARKTLGNGSDTARMERQQQFLGALVKKVQSNGVLLNPTRLYPVLEAATKSITTDPGLDSLRDLYDLTRSIRSIPTEKVQFLTVPRQPHSADPNRDELVQPEAGQLFRSLREDEPVTVEPTGERDGAEASGEPDAQGTTGPSPTPTFPGTNAAEEMCE